MTLPRSACQFVLFDANLKQDIETRVVADCCRAHYSGRTYLNAGNCRIEALRVRCGHIIIGSAAANLIAECDVCRIGIAQAACDRPVNEGNRITSARVDVQRRVRGQDIGNHDRIAVNRPE